MLIYSRAEMSYTVECTKKADSYETLDTEHFQPLSELEKTPDTNKKVHSKLEKEKRLDPFTSKTLNYLRRKTVLMCSSSVLMEEECELSSYVIS